MSLFVYTYLANKADSDCIHFKQSALCSVWKLHYIIIFLVDVFCTKYSDDLFSSNHADLELRVAACDQQCCAAPKASQTSVFTLQNKQLL